MVEERQWSVNEGNVRILRDVDELKASLKVVASEQFPNCSLFLSP